MGIIERIKQALTMPMLLARYGYDTSTSRMIPCKITGESNPSCYIGDDGTFCCYSCSAHGDVIDFIMHEENCDTPTAIRIAMCICGISAEETSESTAELKKRARKKEEERREMEIRLQNVIEHNKEVATRFCKEARSHISETMYFLNRGLTAETQKRFNLGYNSRTESVVIPYNRSMTYFITRSVNEKKFFKPRSKFRMTPDGKYDYKNTQGILGKEPVWNAGSLKLKGKTVFVCESPIDAMSLAQGGLNVCATCGTSFNSDFDCHIVFAFDSDEPGESHAKELAKKYNQFWISPPNGFKDWNELLQKDAELFAVVVEMMKKIAVNIERVRGEGSKEQVQK